MSRYYNIVITNPTTGKVVNAYSNGSSGTSYTYSSYVNGKDLPSALDVELDIPVYAFHSPGGAAFIRVWGVSRQEIGQASDLTGFSITVSAGFTKGFPLNKPLQAGVIVQGSILQAIGHWDGPNMSLDLIISPPFGSSAKPSNLVMNWASGTALDTAVKNTLETAYPDYTVSTAISSSLVRSNDEIGFYDSLEQFSSYVNQASMAILGSTTSTYSGAQITQVGTTISVFDGTVASTSSANPTQIAFVDLIGQPVWIDAATIQFMCPMRADLQLSDFIKMPQKIQTNITTDAGSNLTDLKATFQGTFMILAMRHVGHFRMASGDAWVTVFNASTTPVPK